MERLVRAKAWSAIVRRMAQYASAIAAGIFRDLGRLNACPTPEPMAKAIGVNRISDVGRANTVNCWLTVPAAIAAESYGCPPRLAARRPAKQNVASNSGPAIPCAKRASRKTLCGDSCAKSG